MCGITGFIDSKSTDNKGELDHTIRRMADKIQHRGPDDYGAWVDADSGIALGFRRLAILDLSPTGHQPMVSHDGRYVIVFNGEIYNHLEIKQEIVQIHPEVFHGTSDTEVILAAICQWGLDSAVKRLNGMFAISVWDRKEKILHLIRDRIGIKPLYYGWSNGIFFFGSELKSLTAHPRFSAEINRDVINLYLRFGYIPTPYSIYREIYKLIPGTILDISLESQEPKQPREYWSAKATVEAASADPFQGNEQDAIGELDHILRRSVRERMIADVPLGAFLSGGVDSSTIVALMQQQSSQPVKTFTIGFKEKKYNEADSAKEVANHLKTDHTELYVSPDEAIETIYKIPSLYDEPFADSSQVPTFLVSQLTRQKVTVSLSGDGGDELFGGYNRYFWAKQIWSTFGWMPVKFRRAIARAFYDHSSPKALEFWNKLGGVLPGKLRQPLLADKMLKIFEIVPIEKPIDLYATLVSHWKDPASVVIGSREPPTFFSDRKRWARLADYQQLMMYLDLVTYLPDDILVKVDRASMGVSLEARVPFLDDHRVLEFAWRLPQSLKIRGKTGKYILRKVLYQYVPRELIERPKMGFGLPLDEWLRGDLREWAESLLNENKLKVEGFFNPAPIRKKWQEHLAGKNNWQYYLWDILMFQAWLEGKGK